MGYISCGREAVLQVYYFQLDWECIGMKRRSSLSFGQFFYDSFSNAVCSNLSSINAMILHLAAVLMILYNHTHLQSYALLS